MTELPVNRVSKHALPLLERFFNTVYGKPTNPIFIEFPVLSQRCDEQVEGLPVEGGL